MLLPLWLAYCLALVQDRIYRVLHLLSRIPIVGVLFSWLLGAMSNTIDVNAMNMAWRDICFTGALAKKELGYDPEKVALKSEDETLEEAREFAIQRYAELKGEGNTKKKQC